MAWQIISDSSCEFSQEEAKAAGLTVLPLKTIIDGVEYLDGVTLTPAAFYEKLATCSEMPTTSQLTPGEFEAAFRPVVERGDEAVVITLAGALSGTAQSAAVAAARFPGRVWVVDSETVTIGQHILVEYALRLREQGLSAEQAAEALNREKKRVCLLARVETLAYLMKGGRLSKTAGFAGTVLNIKPVLSVEAGAVRVVGKARGARQGGNLLNEFILQKGGVDFTMPYVLGYSGADDSLLREYVEASRALWAGQAEALPMVGIGSTIGTHAGPGAIAAAFFAKKSE